MRGHGRLACETCNSLVAARTRIKSVDMRRVSLLLRGHRRGLILFVALLAVQSCADGVALKHLVGLRDGLVGTKRTRTLVLA